MAEITGMSEKDAKILDEFKTAILENNIAKVKDILNNNTIPANHQYEQGDTALHLAVRSTSPEMVNTILQMENTDLHHQNRRANTALCLAIQLAKPNTQVYGPEERAVLKEKYEKICLALIEKDNNIKITANLKNLMRKSPIDYLSKSVRNKTIQSALEHKMLQQLAKEAQIPQNVKESVQQGDANSALPNASKEKIGLEK